jgi:choice-of-anchor B domain-containing protein
VKNNLFTLILTLIVTQLSAQKNLAFRANLKYPVRSSAIWGYTAPDSKEYALMGLQSGVSIVDITNPDNPLEVFNINCPLSNWREIKTWNHHAYVTNETDSGIMIIDLSFLPDSITTQYWKADSSMLETGHTLFIDENGIMFVNGFNKADDSRPVELRGILIADLNTDPKNPVQVGVYEQAYVHDCYVRGDTIWASEIYNGWFAVINIADKSNPVVLSTHETPNRFTHNCWLSDDGKYLFTTDEVSGANITSYDVSDLDNIKELDRYRSAFNTGVIPHNTHVLGNYIVNSCYKDGVTIVDVTRPDNMVEVGRFDTSPFLSEDGFAGCWGVYPYFPSGTIIASDMEEGLFVLTPDYKRAGYLEGKITNQSNGAPLQNARVELIGNNWFDFSDLSGNYKTGIADSGRYDVRVFMAGCDTKIVKDVLITPGNITTLNVSINCTALSTGGIDVSENYFIAAPSIFNYYSGIRFRLLPGELASSKFTITDISGKLFDTLIPYNTAGEIIFGQQYAPGVYFITLHSEHYFQNLKVIKTK